MHYKTVDVNGRSLKVWIPNDEKEGYSISDYGGWISGIFDGIDSAIEGFKLTFSPDGHEKLFALSNKINNVNGENRLITLGDLVVDK